MITSPVTETIQRLSRRLLPSTWPTRFLLVAIVAASLLIAWFAADVWFYLDDWSFLLNRGVVKGAPNEGLWVPHADHWMTVPTLVYRGIHAVFGLDYMPYGAVVIALHAAIVAVSYNLVRRHGCPPWVAALTSTTLAFAGAGAEALLWDGTMGLLGSLLCGLLAIGFLEHTRLNLPIISWALLVVGLMSSGVGVSATALVVAYAWLTVGLRRALVVMSVPLAVFLAWYSLVGHRGSYIPEDRSVYLQLPNYIWVQLVTTFDKVGVAPAIGGVLVMALLVGPAVLPQIPDQLRRLAYAGQAAALVQLLLSGSRIWAGGWQEGIGRYAYLSLVFLAPAVAVLGMYVAAKTPRKARPVALSLIALLLAGHVTSAADQLRFTQGIQQLGSHPNPRVIKGLAATAAAGEPILSPRIDNFVNSRNSAQLLLLPEIQAAVADTKAEPVDRLNAETWWMVHLSKDGHGLPKPTTVRLTSGFDHPVSAPGCHRVLANKALATLEFPVGPQGAEIEIRVAEPYTVSTRVRRGPLISDRVDKNPSKKSFWVSSTAFGADLLLTLGPAGEYTICY